MIWANVILIGYTGFALALKHTYIEKLVHKAFAPMLNRFIIETFLARYDFNPASSLSQRELEAWNLIALKYYSAWLPKLGQPNFTGVFWTIYGTVSMWRDMIREDHEVGFDDVVRECAGMCMTTFPALKANRNAQVKAALCQDFVYVVFCAHHKSNQTGYFAILNEMNEQMEKTLISIPHASLYIEEYNYESMELLGILMKTLSDKLDFFDDVSKKNGLAKGLLQVVSFTRFKDFCRIKGTTKDVESTLAGINISQSEIVSSLVESWLPKELQNLLQPLLQEKLQSLPTFKQMPKTARTVDAELFYPLPLSIKRELERIENSLTAVQFVFLLAVCQEYRTFARDLHNISNTRSLSDQERMQRGVQRRDIFLDTCSKKLPKHFYHLFHWHTMMLDKAMKYGASIVHFSSLPVDKSNIYPSRMELEYLKNIAWWINEVIKSVPVKERKEHLKLMLQFVSEEVNYLVPFEQGELVSLTIVLMIDGGFKTNLRIR